MGPGQQPVSVEKLALLESLGYLASKPAHADTGVIRYEPERVDPGWNLYVSQHAQHAWVIDIEGEVVHEWGVEPGDTDPPGSGLFSIPLWWRTVRPFPNGDILAQTDFGSLAKLDRDSNVLWVFPEDTHHDFDVREDGHIFVLIHRLSEVAGLVGVVLEDFIVEVDEDGKEVRELSSGSGLARRR